MSAVIATQPETPLLNCHWIDGAGSPLAATVKVAEVVPGRFTVAAAGWVVMAGAVCAMAEPAERRNASPVRSRDQV